MSSIRSTPPAPPAQPEISSQMSELSNAIDTLELHASSVCDRFAPVCTSCAPEEEGSPLPQTATMVGEMLQERTARVCHAAEMLLDLLKRCEL